MIVYIGGYGRSGSTLFDVILDNHPEIFGAGELTWLFRRAADGKNCTCGKRLTECEIWGQVLDSVQRRLPDVSLQSLAQTTLQCEGVFPVTGLRHVYDTAWTTVFQSLSAVTGCGTIVDSSKSNRVGFRRFSLVATIHQEPGRMIHLVRSASSTLSSLKRGSNKSLAAGNGIVPWGGAVRGLVSWSFSNVAAEWNCRHTPQQRIVIRYEDLISNPLTAIEQTGCFLDLDMSPVLDMIRRDRPFTGGHAVDGNRMRRSKSIRLNRSSMHSVPLSKWDRCLLRLTALLERRYLKQATNPTRFG